MLTLRTCLRVCLCAASSTGLLLKTLGYNVTAIKIDPYMNIDAGTMSPTEHGKLHPFRHRLSWTAVRELIRFILLYDPCRRGVCPRRRR